jgi:tetratricopeptide (TPR) repeat protein
VISSLAILLAAATSFSAFDYRALVEGYRKYGRPQVEQLLAAPAADVEREVRGALAPSSGWLWEDIRAAALLHTEAGLRAQKNKDSRGAEFHITLAQKLLDRVVELSRPQKDFAIRWYAVVPRLLRTFGGGGLGQRLETYGESKWGHDPARASYTRGLGFEATAAREGVIPEPGESSVFTGSTRIEAYLVPAAEAFADALKQDPGLHGASLHLGRVRLLQGQRAEAATLFRGALDDVDPAVAYLAALFLGSLEERNERYDAAEKLYRDAVRRIPWGQSAPLALSELLSRTGREKEARDTLAAHFTFVGSGIIDPLWTYTALPSDELGTRFDLLRMEVWK